MRLARNMLVTLSLTLSILAGAVWLISALPNPFVPRFGPFVPGTVGPNRAGLLTFMNDPWCAPWAVRFGREDGENLTINPRSGMLTITWATRGIGKGLPVMRGGEMLGFRFVQWRWDPSVVPPPRLQPDEFGFFQFDRFGPRADTTTLSFPLWCPTLLFGAWPVLAVIRGPLRRRYRRRRGLRLHCGYILTGLPQPRCPECGTVFLAEENPAADGKRLA